MTTLNALQNKIWLDRYALRDESGHVVEDTIDETFRRVADYIGDTDEERGRFFALLQDFHFVPGGRILSGAGAEQGKTFYNCYVIPIETKARRLGRNEEDTGNDSREAIFDTISTMVSIMSRGGGVGINWSVLRPRGAYLYRVSGTTSGPVSWMDVASRAVGVVEQGGSRRGAAMFMLDDWHPDLEEFIDAKRNNSLITNANVSVAVSDAFMAAVREGSDWTLRYPDTSDPSYDAEWSGDISAWERSGRPIIDYRTVPARDLWKRLTDAAWASGEPGVVFLDRYNKLSTANGEERIISVNPCGEQGLGAYSVCNLGAMNLDAYVDGWHFDWDRFLPDVQTAVRFLDNVIDKDSYFVPETEKQQKRLRRMGLGVMGLADAMVRMGMRYGSKESVDFVSLLFESMKKLAIGESVLLAYEKGPAPAWHDSMWQRPYLYGIPHINGHSMRNLFLLTQAPTGTTSLLAGVNSGIEPYYDIKTIRRDRTGESIVYAKAVHEMMKDGIVPPWAVTSNDVTVEEHIAIQAAAQKFIDSSVSKTINAPEDQTPEETAQAYMMAYEAGCKGLAYYRDKSRDVQVLHHEEKEPVLAKIIFLDKRQGDMIQSCPACESEVVHEEGCMKCLSCGWAAC